jgi:uncharacterized protein
MRAGTVAQQRSLAASGVCAMDIGPTENDTQTVLEEQPDAEQHPRGDAPARRGFAAMDPDKQRAIASMGGKAAHKKGGAHEFNSDEARAAGRAGGERVSTDRQHMREIGKKGGERVSRDRAWMAQIGKRGGQAVSVDRRHMSALGRKGGSARRPPASE